MNEQEMRALDEWIAINIFGWQEFREEEFPHRLLWREGEPGTRVWDEPCGYTTDPAAAMLVLEKCRIRCCPYGVNVSGNENGAVVSTEAEPLCIVTADTFPLAICLFAKKLFKDSSPPPQASRQSK